MIVEYKYKDKLFQDMRDIINNNKVSLDFDYILDEFLPFQGFVSGRTFFKGVNIVPSVKFEVSNAPEDFNGFDKKFFSESLENYLEKYGFNYVKNPVAAVSGGIDSSVVVLELKPPIVYTGYYENGFFDEVPYSSTVAKVISAEHLTFRLTESDFMENLDEYLNTVCSPVGGMGGVMEMALLKKVKTETNTEGVLFGTGGDEIFMGYYFNYFVKEFYENGYKEPKYMSNFLPFKVNLTNNVIDFMIVSSLNRGPLDLLFSPFVLHNFLPKIRLLKSVIDKILFVNINCTLPTLLHIYTQLGNALGVKCFSPLANESFVKIARFINTLNLEIPKQLLREIRSDMPILVKENYIKRGFPIPVANWHQLNKVMEETYNSFFERENVRLEKIPYSGITRFSWGVFQVELMLRKYYR